MAVDMKNATQGSTTEGVHDLDRLLCDHYCQIARGDDGFADSVQVMQEWVNAPPQERKARALAVVDKLFNALLRKTDLPLIEDASHIVESHIQLWYDAEPSWESLLSRLGTHFYRDHLEHSLRVALLSLFIWDQSGYVLRNLRPDYVLIAGLWHDIGIALRSLGAMPTETWQARTTALPGLNRSPGSEHLDVLSLGYALETEVLEANKDLQRIDSPSAHAAVAAVILVHLLKDRNLLETDPAPEWAQWRQVVRAVYAHDPQVAFVVDGAEDPFALLLIIADELQDWGRAEPRAQPAFSASQRLSVRNEGDHVLVTLDYSAPSVSSFPLMRVAEAKLHNLRRIRTGRAPIGMRITWRVPAPQASFSCLGVLQVLSRLLGHIMSEDADFLGTLADRQAPNARQPHEAASHLNGFRVSRRDDLRPWRVIIHGPNGTGPPPVEVWWVEGEGEPDVLSVHLDPRKPEAALLLGGPTHGCAPVRDGHHVGSQLRSEVRACQEVVRAYVAAKWTDDAVAVQYLARTVPDDSTGLASVSAEEHDGISVEQLLTLLLSIDGADHHFLSRVAH